MTEETIADDSSSTMEETSLRFDRSASDGPGAAVVEAVVETTGTPMEELPPLYDAIDPDTLDEIFGDDARASEAGALLSFDYAGTRVFVNADGVEVRPSDSTNGGG